MLKHVESIFLSLQRLGARRLIALAVIGLTVIGVTSGLGYYLSRPDLETLYVGLDRMDVSRIGSALKDAGIPFDVNAEGTSVFVPYGQTARARVLLAEKGLPQSAKGGYELFDRIGSLGLTSFMQHVTKVRALEGELSRTIQAIQGVKAARVHVVLPDEGSFRRARQPPSASIVIRTEGVEPQRAAQAVRQLVAAAVPDMTPARVTVLGADGVVLASGGENDDSPNAAAGGKLALEGSIARALEDNIRRTLTPYLSLKNFQVSVVARANLDKRQVQETIFNPDTKVERSVRVVQEKQRAENGVSKTPTSVAANVAPAPAGDDRKQSNEALQKREETTNYEISSKTITTIGAGHVIEGLSVALVVNRAALADGQGKPLAEPELKAKLAQIEGVVIAAAGLDKKRGDRVDLLTVDFAVNGGDAPTGAEEGWRDILMRQSGALVRAITALGVALLLLLFGLRPALRILSAPAAAPATPEPSSNALPDLSAGAAPQAVAPPEPTALIATREEAPRDRLRRLVEQDAERAAAVLKRWAAEGKAA